MLINDLPVEVFIRIVDTWFTIEESSSRYGLTFINRLRMVCKRWRDAIDSEPTFWTHIQVGGQGTPDNAPTIATKLTKSGAAGLNIKYNTNFAYAGGADGLGSDFQAFVELLAQHADRLESMQTCATWCEHRELLPILGVQRFPKLELIMVETVTYVSHPMHWSFKGCPKLHTLLVERHPLPQEVGRYGQLKLLEIRDHVCSREDLIKALDACTNLERLTLYRTDLFDVTPYEASSRTKLPRLTELVVWASSNAVTTILQSIWAPGIASLTLGPCRYNPSEGPPLFDALLGPHKYGSSQLETFLQNCDWSANKLCLDVWPGYLGMSLTSTASSFPRRHLEIQFWGSWDINWLQMLSVVLASVNPPVYLFWERLEVDTIVSLMAYFPTMERVDFGADTKTGDIVGMLEALSRPLLVALESWPWSGLQEVVVQELDRPAEDLKLVLEQALIMNQARLQAYGDPQLDQLEGVASSTSAGWSLPFFKIIEPNGRQLNDGVL